MYKKCCAVCGVGYTAKRPNALYCSERCRGTAKRARKRGDLWITSRILSKQELADVRTLSNLSWEAAETVIQIASIAGAEAARHVLDGYWSLMIACKVDINRLAVSA